MDSKVTVRFFRVSTKPTVTDDFPNLILAAVEPETIGDRERTLDGSVTLRLERCVEEGEFVAGEFCRKQTENIPPGAGPSGLMPLELEDGQGLGHVAAFRYHKPTRVILLQHNYQCASANRIAAYVAAANPAAIFFFSPVLREDAWERFANKRIRSMALSFASPENLDALDQEGIAAARGAKLLAEAYDGVKVTITVGVGRSRNKHLNFTRVQQAINAILGSDARYKKVKVKTDQDDDDKEIDFLKEHLKSSKVLDLPSDDFSEHYEVRKSYLQEVFSDNLEYLHSHFGSRADGGR